MPQNPQILILGNELNPYGRPRRHGMAEVYFDIKPNKRAEEIQKIAKSRLPEQNEILRQHFKDIFNAKLVSNDELKNIIKEGGWQEFNRDIITEDKHFPTIFCSNPGIHPLRYSPKEIKKLSEKFPSIKNDLHSISQSTNADILVLAVSEPKVFGVGAGGFVAKMQLEMHLFVFNAKGELISYVNGNSKPINTGGKKMGDYMETFDEFNELSLQLVKSL